MLWYVLWVLYVKNKKLYKSTGKKKKKNITYDHHFANILNLNKMCYKCKDIFKALLKLTPICWTVNNAQNM